MYVTGFATMQRFENYWPGRDVLVIELPIPKCEIKRELDSSLVAVGSKHEAGNSVEFVFGLDCYVRPSSFASVGPSVGGPRLGQIALRHQRRHTGLKIGRCAVHTWS